MIVILWFTVNNLKNHFIIKLQFSTILSHCCLLYIIIICCVFVKNKHQNYSEYYFYENPLAFLQAPVKDISVEQFNYTLVVV